jgi:hypothetical protein
LLEIGLIRWCGFRNRDRQQFAGFCFHAPVFGVGTGYFNFYGATRMQSAPLIIQPSPASLWVQIDPLLSVMKT